jgi:hypothetical protein
MLVALGRAIVNDFRMISQRSFVVTIFPPELYEATPLHLATLLVLF